ncbi:hypothetical protein MFLO_00055 [Listeria floridensis FSL S10-1187]|uniref:DNA double-strand break repair Rad50 ATPase n=1 Tax=Listeria floridensis FSL S10-1187 TaxID=1265817 RepID=A0ABP3B110_9LIST|nr:hypothetical protein [Listeria floridensis]EUJ33603.1 hypothetical protein MFLO_00055 [Listeria floridensis FSL S10-1187]
MRYDQLAQRFSERNNEKLQFEERRKSLSIERKQSLGLDEEEAKAIEQLLETYRVYRERKEQEQEREFEQGKLNSGLSFKVDTSLLPRLQKLLGKDADEIAERLREEQKQVQELQFDVQLEKKEEARVQQEIDELEAVMWPRSEYQKHEAELGKAEKAAAQPLPFAVLYLVFGAGAAIFWPGIWTYLLAITSFIVLLAVMFVRKPKQDNHQAQTAFEEQKRYRAKWKNLLGKLDALLLGLAEREGALEAAEKELLRLEGKRQEFYAELGVSPQGEFEADLARLREDQFKLERSQDLAERSRTGRAFLQKWEADLGEFGELSETPEESVAVLRQKLAVYRENMAFAAKNEEKLEQVEAELDLALRDLRKMQEEMKQLLDEASAETEADFRAKGFRAKELAAIRERFTLLSAQIPETLKFKDYEAFAALKERELKLREQLSRLESEQVEFERKRAEKRHELAVLEEGGTFSLLTQEFYMERDKLQGLADEWIILKLAQQLVENTVGHLQETKFPKALELSSNYFSKLTGDRYQKVMFNESKRLEVLREDKVIFKPEELSQATKEQLYLAVRLALIETIAEDYPLPIVIDDGFVNFDAHRLELLMELLKYRKTKNQILFFTCHKETSKYFSDNAVLMLY